MKRFPSVPLISERIRGAVFTVMLILAPAIGHAQSYAVTQLDSPPGKYSFAFAINNTGQVAGSIEDYTSGNATLWSGNTFTSLSGITGIVSSVGLGINNSGQVVGRSYSVATNGGFLENAARWSGGTGYLLPTLGGIQSNAFGINDAGQAVGWSDINRSTGPGGPPAHAALWNGSVVSDLGTLGGDNSRAYGINNAGQVVGEAQDVNGAFHASLWNGTTLVNLGEGTGRSINDYGQVVGSVQNGLGQIHAKLWNGTSEILLKQLAGYSFQSEALDINNSGQIVGYSSKDSNGHDVATLWTGTSATNLNSLISGPLALYLSLTSATAISDSGTIVANGFDSRDGMYHGYLLSVQPVPVPAALWLLFSGLSGVGLVARRKASHEVLRS